MPLPLCYQCLLLFRSWGHLSFGIVVRHQNECVIIHSQVMSLISSLLLLLFLLLLHAYLDSKSHHKLANTLSITPLFEVAARNRLRFFVRKPARSDCCLLPVPMVEPGEGVRAYSALHFHKCGQNSN